MSSEASPASPAPSAATPQDPPVSKPPAAGEAEAWTISFATTKKRKVSKKERLALEGGNRVAKDDDTGTAATEVDPEQPAKALPVVNAAEFIDMAVAVPRDLATTKADMQRRNYFDNERFLCMTRQYKRTCGISSLTSVWNLLYSRLGHGTLPPVSQEEIMSILGFAPPFDEIRWGSFTGNTTLMRWFHAINKHFGVTGKAYFLWKCHGIGRTVGLTDDKAEELVKETLRSPKQAIIYHCHNHYMVPIGYQEQPLAQVNVYAASLDKSETETTLMIGEVSRGKHQSMHIKKFAHVAQDLNCQSPNYFNIRRTDLGVQYRKTRRAGGNLHCFMCFRSDMVEENLQQFEDAEEEDGDDDAQDTPDAVDADDDE